MRSLSRFCAMGYTFALIVGGLVGFYGGDGLAARLLKARDPPSAMNFT
ncbi:hypothetical protein [Burkholderia anthina]|nr:hypothetical protein [Burkholderia anthina]QTD95319.1 hypothetical protein J4G50_38340 [Burkholderia anthina]